MSGAKSSPPDDSSIAKKLSELKLSDDKKYKEELKKYDEYQKKLKEKEHELNIITAGYPQISIENNEDMEQFPPDFTFINNNQEVDVNIPEVSKWSCTCTTDCIRQYNIEQKEKCVAKHGKVYEFKFPYKVKNKRNKHGIIDLKEGQFIFECNKLCKCPPKTCSNRVVQNGSSLKLCIFKTENKGWGVKTLESIPEGAFVIEYVGEVCSAAKIRSREKECKNNKYGHDTTYLFDINARKQKKPNVIDATYYGNISRFISHACKSESMANLRIHNVLINNYDVMTHRIALFATKEINEGDELTLDYGISGPPNPLVPEEDKKKCRCHEHCPRYLYFRKK